jgi:serine/threonine protein kinase
VLQLLHMDFSPNNILEGPERTTLVIDFGLTSRSQDPAVFSGTKAFMSLERLWNGKATLSGELESLLYVMLYWACNGHLPWKRAAGRYARSAKYEAMKRLFEVSIMG